MIDSVENIGNWSFFGCTKLRKVKFGSNIKNIDVGSFWLCTSLEEVENLDKVKTIAVDAFHNCQKLNNVIINEDVNYIGGNAFVSCDELKTVIINSPVIVKNITSANSCGCLVRYAKTIYIKESITEIGNYITQNFVTINSDKDGYIKYEKGNN